MNCQKCNKRLGTKTVTKGLTLCLQCRKLISKKCLDCNDLIKWNQIRCKNCQKKHWSNISSGNKNPMFGRSVFDIHVKKFGFNTANELKHQLYEKQKLTRKLNGGCSGNRNSMFGKTMSTSAKEKLKMSHLGQKNPMYKKSVLDIWISKYGSDIAKKMWENKVRKQALSITGYKNGMFKNHWTKIWIKKYGENETRIKKRQVFKITKPELELKQFFIDNGIEFQQQYTIISSDKIYFYDFFLPKYNILIEVDGDYWHCKNENHRPSSFEQIIQNDLNKNQIAKNSRFKLVRIWSSELKINWRLI